MNFRSHCNKSSGGKRGVCSASRLTWDVSGSAQSAPGTVKARETAPGPRITHHAPAPIYLQSLSASSGVTRCPAGRSRAARQRSAHRAAQSARAGRPALPGGPAPGRPAPQTPRPPPARPSAAAGGDVIGPAPPPRPAPPASDPAAPLC